MESKFFTPFFESAENRRGTKAFAEQTQRPAEEEEELTIVRISKVKASLDLA